MAYSEACPRQIIEYSSLVFGFQCHLELTKGSIEELIKYDYKAEQVSSLPWVQSIAELLSINTKHINALLFNFLDGLVLK